MVRLSIFAYILIYHAIYPNRRRAFFYGNPPVPQRLPARVLLDEVKGSLPVCRARHVFVLQDLKCLEWPIDAQHKIGCRNILRLLVYLEKLFQCLHGFPLVPEDDGLVGGCLWRGLRLGLCGLVGRQRSRHGSVKGRTLQNKNSSQFLSGNLQTKWIFGPQELSRKKLFLSNLHSLLKILLKS